MSNQNLPRVTRIKSVTPVSYLESFDMMSRFLSSEKAKQVSVDFVGDAFLTSASQIWDDLRLSCNSIRDEQGLPREPVASWKDENGIANMEPDTPMTTDTPTTTMVAAELLPEKATFQTPVKSDSDDSSSSKNKKKSSKKEKKEAKKAKKSAKKAEKSAKKAAKKEAKKAKKEAKKKRHSV